MSSMSVNGHVSDAREARRFVEVALEGYPAALLEEVKLLTTEIVHNAVIHANERRVSIDVTAGLRYVKVEVMDSSPVLPVLADSMPSLKGRGLQIVNLLSSDWGVEEVPGGKVVWFEMNVSAGG